MTKSMMKTVVILTVILIVAAVAYRNRAWIMSKINATGGE